MEKEEFAEREKLCQKYFEELGEVYHVCTPENHPLLFKNKEDFKIGMSLFALCVLKFPEIKIITFLLNLLRIYAMSLRISTGMVLLSIVTPLLFLIRGEPTVIITIRKQNYVMNLAERIQELIL